MSNECIVLIALLFILKNNGVISFTQLLIIASFLSTTAFCGLCDCSNNEGLATETV